MRKTVSNKAERKRKIRPALTPEARENQMIALAIDEAERLMIEGKAPSQIITHYLKLGTSKERLEKEKLVNENVLLKAKVKAYESQQETKELYSQVVAAMKRYGGDFEDGEDEFYEDPDIY